MTQRSSISTSPAHIAHLRQLAADVGLLVPVGPGAGVLGNVSALMTLLAVGYEQRPDAVRQFIAALQSLQPTHQRGGR